MKFTLPKDVLLKTIQTTQNAINPKTNLPILSNLLIEADADKIVFTGTDLDMGIVSNISIKPSVVGAITVPAKKFLDIVRELPNRDVGIYLRKNNMLSVECEKISLKVIGLPKEEFPQLPSFENKEAITIQQKRLKSMLAMTSFAVSHDETRYVLNGILFIVKPSFLRLVATDGRRLAMVEASMQFPKAKETKMVVPTKAIQELGRMLSDEGDVGVLFGENQICFDMGSTKVVSRLIEGEFPNYEQVIPKETKDKVGLSKDEFLAATKRANLFTSQDSMAVKIDLSKDKMILSKSAPYIGEIRDELNVDYKGRDLVIGFNPDYLIDVLKSIDVERFNFELTDSEKPAVIRFGNEYVYVVLPMQLGA